MYVLNNITNTNLNQRAQGVKNEITVKLSVLKNIKKKIEIYSLT